MKTLEEVEQIFIDFYDKHSLLVLFSTGILIGVLGYILLG